ncbi:MAG: hypothetical protein PGN08_00840 [Sphingomonas taxi]
MASAAALALGLAACSDGGEAPAANATEAHAPVARRDIGAAPVATPAVAPSPVASAAPQPLPDDAAPEVVVQRYADALAAGRYDEAWALWDEDGAASGMTRQAFAASFARYASYRATVGTPYDADAGAGQRYVTVPLTVTGTLKTDGPFRLEGPLVLHKAADGIDSDDPHAHAWRIRSSELKPRPAA